MNRRYEITINMEVQPVAAQPVQVLGFGKSLVWEAAP